MRMVFLMLVKGEEFHFQSGQGSVRAEFAIRLLKDLEKVVPHVRLD